MRVHNAKLPVSIKGEYNVATERYVLWCGLLELGKYLPTVRRTRYFRGYIKDGKRKVYFCRYGLFNEPMIWENAG